MSREVYSSLWKRPEINGTGVFTTSIISQKNVEQRDLVMLWINIVLPEQITNMSDLSESCLIEKPER